MERAVRLQRIGPLPGDRPRQGVLEWNRYEAQGLTAWLEHNLDILSQVAELELLDVQQEEPRGTGSELNRPGGGLLKASG